jgi:hypothetical protein
MKALERISLWGALSKKQGTNFLTKTNLKTLKFEKPLKKFLVSNSCRLHDASMMYEASPAVPCQAAYV